MKTLRTITAVAAWLLMAAGASGEDRMTVGGVQYATTGNTTATACLTVKAVGDVEISETIKIKGKVYTTTEVGQAYFGKNNYLQSISIPNTVRRIRKKAFAGCSNLVSVRIPNSNCTVDPEAFKGCVAITFICNDDTQLYPVDYVLAAMPKDIPYYENPEKCKGSGVVNDLAADGFLPDLDWPVDSVLQKMAAAKAQNTKTFAFIIGNEDYSMGGTSNAEFAANDAKVFKAYCQKVLGLPERNIKCYTNQTLGMMRRTMRLMQQTANANKDVNDSRLIFYYSGHGMPNDATKDGFMVPVDVDGRHTEDCISLKSLYADLGQMPFKKVFVFLDACFSGAARDGAMLNKDAKAVAVEVKEEKPKANTVVLTAATGAETAYPYKEKRHGLFTYYLLNMLYRSKGNCNVGELGEYVKSKVEQKSNVNEKRQTPTLTTPPAGKDGANWRNVTLK